MSSQPEQAVVQAAADAYVTAHQGILLFETNAIHQCDIDLFLYSLPWYV